MRRFLSLLLAVLMVLSTCMVGAVSVTATSGEASSGTSSAGTDYANKTYEPLQHPETAEAISTGAEFVEKITANPSGVYYLANDLVGDNKVTATVATFTGQLYGNGKVIQTTVPLFGTIDGSSLTKDAPSLNDTVSVCDLTIKGSIALTDNADTADVDEAANAGTLARTATDARVHRVSNEANVSGSTSVGGIVGAVTVATASTETSPAPAVLFNACVNKGAITASSGNAGGIVGSVASTVSDTAAIIQNCVNEGTIVVSTNGKAGSIVGLIDGCSSATVSSCTSTGDVTAEKGNAGGVTGQVYFRGEATVSFTSCVVTGSVFGKDTTGGLAGIVSSVSNETKKNFNIRSCAYLGDTLKSNNQMGGLIGYSGANTPIYNVDSCVVATSIEGTLCVGGLYGALSGSNVTATTTNCLVFGSITTTYKGTGDKNRCGGLIGYASGVGDDEFVFRNNAIYADITRTAGGESVSALASYYNSGQGTFENNVYVGSMTVKDGMTTAFANAKNNVKAISGNYYFRTDGGKFDYNYNKVTDMTGATQMETATQNVTSSLTGWEYVTGLAVPGKAETFTGNIPAGAKATIEAVGTASASTAVTISTPAEFYEMQPDGNYKLGANLELSYSYDFPFTGTLDGAGYTITLTGAPVFWYAANATIKNVKLANAVINNSESSVGALAFSASNLTLDNVSSTASVTAAYDAGGLVGSVTGSLTATNCVVTADVTATNNSRAGGFVGVIESASATTDVTFTGCSYAGTVSGTDWTGGIAGRLLGTYDVVSITDCQVSGSVSTPRGGAGGLVGPIATANTFNAEDCIVSASVSGDNNTAGIIPEFGSLHVFNVDSCVVSGSLATDNEHIAGVVARPGSMNVDNYIFTVNECAILSPSITKTDDDGQYTAGVVGYFIQNTDADKGPVYTAQKAAITSCVVVSDISSVNGGVGGILAVKQTHKGSAFEIKGNVFFGTIIGSHADRIGGIVGYMYNTGAMDCQYNAVYGTISNRTGSVSVGLGYGTIWENTLIKNNVFVGKLNPATHSILIFGKNTSRLGMENEETYAAKAQNYYYRTDSYDPELHPFYAAYSKTASLCLSISDYPYAMGYATEDLTGSDKLGSTDWAYESDILIMGERFTGNLPKGALATLRAAGAITAPVQLVANADGFTKMEADGYYKLTADIELSASYAQKFTGVLDGDGHTITLTGNAPVFSELEGAKIYNVMIKGSINDTTSASVGALANTANGVTLDNITANVTVSGTSTVGGLIGTVSGDVSIKDCSVIGEVTSSGNYAGGIVGSANTSALSIQHCVNACNVKNAVTIGGIVASVTSTGPVLVEKCVSTGEVTNREAAAGTDAGGVIGYLGVQEGTTTVSILDNAVTGFLGLHQGAGGGAGGVIGRLIGYSDEAVDVTLSRNVYCAAELLSGRNTGGLIGLTKNFNSLLLDSNVVLTDLTADYYIGGLIGDLRDVSSVTISNNFLKGSVTKTGGGSGEGPRSYVSAFVGYMTLSPQMENNAAYMDIYSTQAPNYLSVCGYHNSGSGYFNNNVYVGSIARTDGVDVPVSLANCGNPAGWNDVSGNYYYRTNVSADGSIVYKSTRANENDTLLTADHATLLSSPDAKAESLDSTVWTYVENYVLPNGETFTGNIPVSALEALDVETTTYGSFPLEVNSVDAFLNMLPGGYYKLTADIVLPEGASYALPFYGKLDGNGHKITVNGAPAFSYVSAGAIQNLTVDGELDNTNANAGAIAPEASFISLENVTVDVFVSATENAGGFVGVVYGVGSFVGCTNKGIVSASTNAGGIVGLALGNTTLRGCTNEGAVSANTNAGGFVGSASAAVAFDACANKASVSASNGNAGGIVGLIHENCTFHSCTNEGAVSASTNAGGILGSATSTVVKLDSCKSTGTVVATTNAGGIVGTIIGDKTNKPISSIEINDCVATGTVAATNYAGGIIARALNMVEGYSFNITNCAYFGAGVSAGCAGGIISNLNSSGPKADTSQWIGLHGCVVVTNVSSTGDVGGLIGSINYGDGTRSTINGCFFKGKISTTKNTNSVGGLIGYLAGTAAMKSKYEDNVVYATIQKAGANTHGAIVGYANCRSKTFDFYRNIFVGTIYSTNHTFAVTHNYTSIANGGAANSQYLGKSENNFWYSDDANLEFNSFANNKGSTNPTAYTDAMLQKMSSAAQNLITEGGFSADLWAYETEYSIMGESYTGNIPAAALATMKALMPSGSTVGEIYEAADLLVMDPNGSYKLMNNITLDTSYTLPFNGTLDGSGYTITVNGAPVFSSINAATVKDLTIKVEGALSATVDYAGALAAEANFASLSNVTVDGNAISAEKAAGGLIGIVKVTGEFVNCTSNVSVSSADAAGGIVGSFSGNGAFANCTNNAVVSGTGIAGGIVGILKGNCVFNSCSNKGAITSSAKMAGGVVGASLSGYTSFTGCSNEGSVNGYSFAGGIVSVVAVNTNFVNCSNKGAVTATGNVEQFNGFAGGITAYVGSTVTEDGAIQDVASDGDRKNVCDPREYTVFDHCSNTGDVSGMRYVGGILGTTFDSASFEYCSNSNDGKISGSDDARLYTGGIAGAVFVEGDFYRCDNSGDVYGNAMTGGIAGASGLSNYVGPFGGQRFVGCTHTGLVSVTSVEGISNDVARVPGGIVGYARSDVPYRSIVISYCAITGDIELHMVEGYKANSASVLAGTVADLTHAVFEYNYFTGKISADKSGVVLYLPYDNNSAVAEENVKGNYSVYQSGLYFGLDSSGLTELPEDYIIKTKYADGKINYTWLLEILNENFEGEAFVLLNGIAVLNDEYNVVGNIPETPEEITTAEEFLAMDPYGNYKLMADITLDKSYEYIFAGILDGNGHTITITAPIFEAVEGATIYSLTIDGSIETEAQNIGALANFADGITLNGVTNNTDILNKISVTSDNDYSKATGGLVGKAVGTVTLTRCRNNGKITAAMPGGLVGFAAKATFTATDCVNAGVLTNYSTKVASAGGILAYGELGSYEFTDCYNTGDLLFASATGYGVLAGGIVGSIRGNANTIALDGCANGGKIVANSYVGGLVGLAIGLTESEFTDCKNAGMIISSGDFAGGIAAWVSNSTTTKAGNKVSEVPCNTSVTHYFTNCTNIGDVTADGRQASGILTHTADFATFKYCLNTGDIRTRTGNTDYSHAAGITSWSGGETKILYCVNTGDVTGAANAAGIGGYLGHRSDAFEYHTITGCVTTGNIVSEYPSACGRSDAVGIVRMTNSDGYYINGCVVDGTIKSLGGNAYGLFHYANVTANNVSGNVILLEPGDISAAQHTYLVADVAGSITPSNRVDSLYIRPGVFTDMFSGVKGDETRYPMPESYGYLFTDEDLTDGDLLTWMNAYELEDFVAKKSFVMNDGMPMHKEVDDVYNLRNLTFDDIIPSAALPEVEPDTEPDEDESTTPEDSDSSEPESSEVVDPDTSDSEPESSEVVDPGTSDSEPDDDNTTEPKDNDTTKEPADESTTGGDANTDKPDDDKKKGCGSVVSATLALAAIALIAPAMVVIKKKDEE